MLGIGIPVGSWGSCWHLLGWGVTVGGYCWKLGDWPKLLQTPDNTPLCLEGVRKLVKRQVLNFSKWIIFCLVSSPSSDLVLAVSHKITNDISSTLVRQQHYAAIFFHLPKAFDKVDRSTFINRLSSIGVSGLSLAWFCNDLTDRVSSEQHHTTPPCH